MTRIPAAQDLESQLKLLRARQSIYTHRKGLLVLQLTLTVLLPVLGAILSRIFPDMKAPVAAVALVITFIDTGLIDQEQKRLLKRSALIAEEFDCAVLNLPWDQFTAGHKVKPEDIHAAARKYAARHDDSRLLGWYPSAVARLPAHAARLVCQRSNLRYGGELRAYYRRLLKFGPFSLAAILVLFGLAANKTVTDWVLTVTLLTPVFSWALREYYRQLDAVARIENLMGQFQSLWHEVVNGTCGENSCATRSRELQTAIFLRRSSDSPLPPFIYRLNRSRLEEEMNQGAAAMIREYEDFSVRAAAREQLGAEM